MSDTIKNAADFLREDLAIYNHNVRSSHAHAAVAAYCGHNSKKALLDSSSIDIEDEFLSLKINPDIQKLEKVISKMRDDTPLKHIPIERIARSIHAGLTPPCECCSTKKHNVMPIGDLDALGDEPDGWVCHSCAESDDSYARCEFCGDEAIYRADQINSRGECPEHNGESHMDDEEREGWMDTIEYWNKDN